MKGAEGMWTFPTVLEAIEGMFTLTSANGNHTVSAALAQNMAEAYESVQGHSAGAQRYRQTAAEHQELLRQHGGKIELAPTPWGLGPADVEGRAGAHLMVWRRVGGSG